MAVNGRQKGAQGEREWRDFLKSYGYSARRGQQYSGIGEAADVVSGLDDWVMWEVKRVEQLNVEKALQQAERDAARYDHAPWPVVAHRKNREEWKITMRADDFMELIGYVAPPTEEE